MVARSWFRGPRLDWFSGFDLWDLGEHRLRDLSGVVQLFQVRGGGLVKEFPRLRTVDAAPGNLPM